MLILRCQFFCNHKLPQLSIFFSFHTLFFEFSSGKMDVKKENKNTIFIPEGSFQITSINGKF